MIDSKQLRQYVIVPTLKSIGLYSAAATELLVLTAAVESAGGQYLHQLGRGPACGVFQMEPATHDDCWTNFLRFKAGIGIRANEIDRYLSRLAVPDQADLANRVRQQQIPGLFDGDNAQEMCGNWYYATAMARIKYLRVPKALPAADDVEGMAEYHKRYYNTAGGASVVADSVRKYRAYA